MDAMRPLSNDSFSYRWLINVKPSTFDALDDDDDAATDGDPFIEIDPWLASLRRASVDVGAAYDFDFGLPGARSPPVFAPADQIFSDGLILPLHLLSPPEAAAAHRSSDSDESVLSRSLSVEYSSRRLRSLSNRFKPPHLYSAPPGRPMSDSSPPLRLLSGGLQARPQPTDYSPSERAALSRRPGGHMPRLPSRFGKTPKRILQRYLVFLISVCKKVKELKKLACRAEGASAVVPALPGSASPASPVSTPRGVDYCQFTMAPPDTGMEKSIHDAVLHCKRSASDPRTVSSGCASDEQRQVSAVTK